MADPKTIYLEPVCPDCGERSEDGRLWCQDDVWGGHCECGAALPPASEYRLIPSSVSSTPEGGSDES